jgi:hypothetical protein
MDNTPYYHKTLFWSQPDEKLMYRIISTTEVYLLQCKGRDMGKEFKHRHEKVVFPSAERLAEDLQQLKGDKPLWQESDQKAWESLLSEYLQLNQEKLNVIRDIRFKIYNQPPAPPPDRVIREFGPTTPPPPNPTAQ